VVSTVTSSTVAALAPATGVASALALVAVLTCLALLIQQEIVSTVASAPPEAWPGALRRGLNIGIAPLGLACVVIAAVQILAVLR
jgi:hypothetical protein